MTPEPGAESDAGAETGAERRVLRAIALGFAPGALVFGVLAVPGVVAQWAALPPWWSLGALALTLAPALAMGCAAPAGPLPLVRALAVLSTAGLVVAQATAPVVAVGRISESLWLNSVSGLGVVAAAVGWRPRVAAVLAVVVAGFVLLDDTAIGGNGALLPAAQSAAYALLFYTTFVALAAGVLRGARAVDAAQAGIVKAAAEAAAEEARDRERGRVNALVHDRVLATLLAASRGGEDTAALRRADARRALADLGALLEDRPEPVAAPAEDLPFTLQAATTLLAPEARFGYESTPGPPLPSEAVEAITAALEEALRNSLRHAGPAANRAVHVRVEPEVVQVDVLDDGPGFDPARVPPTRLGIAESIRGRMAALPGGDAVIVSTPGVGTRVQLVYRPEQA